MNRIEIDGRTLEAPEGMTVLEAARRLDIALPALCTYAGLPPESSCMLCVVEDRRTGMLIPSCAAWVSAGMRISTGSEAVIEARRAALDLLLSDHVGDCEAPCRRACPARLDIPAMLRCLADAAFDQAARIVGASMALPAVLGRICPAPCEKVCRRGLLDAPVAICALQRLAGDYALEQAGVLPGARGAPHGAPVAVVGAGPAGLSAAYALCLSGHAVTLYEKHAAPGGGLRNPAVVARLPVAVLNAEIARVLACGIELRTAINVGVDLSLDDLKSRFEAIVLAVGDDGHACMQDPSAPTAPANMGVDQWTRRTDDPVVFACGEGGGRNPMAVRSAAQGFAAAASVSQMLLGLPVTGPLRRYDHRLGRRPDAAELANLMQDADAAPRHAPDLSDFAYSRQQARSEARRCLHCECRKAAECRLRDTVDAVEPGRRSPPGNQRRGISIDRRHDLVFEAGKCIVCGTCVRLAEREGEQPGLSFLGRGFDVRVGVPFEHSIASGLSPAVARSCSAACPTGALSVRKVIVGHDP